MTTQISAKIVADSINPKGDRLITYVLEYPKGIIHGEFMTHRMFSRNASSSRAIPVEKQLKRVKEDPAMPVFWGKNQAGMQAAVELDDTIKDLWMGHHPDVLKQTQVTAREAAKIQWLRARDQAVQQVELLHGLGLHKQLANRLLETWMWIQVICTSTDAGLNNFLNLRYHKMAQPEIQVLAQCMWEARQDSVPVPLSEGEYHLPFITSEELSRYAYQSDPLFWQKISAARCARVSYNNHDGTAPDIAKDLELYERLMGGFPKHASPTEHQARVPISGIDTLALPCHDVNVDGGMYDHLRSNLDGWVQFRKLIPGEYLKTFARPANE